MAGLGFGLNTEEAASEFSGAFEVLAPGWYQVVVTGSEIKPTKAGTGKMLELVYEARDGKTLKDWLNIVNPSEVAQKIGRAALGKLAVSIGIKGELKDTNVLHGRPFEVKVEVDEFESNKEAGKMLKSNKVTDYRAVGSAPAAAPSGGTKPKLAF